MYSNTQTSCPSPLIPTITREHTQRLGVLVLVAVVSRYHFQHRGDKHTGRKFPLFREPEHYSQVGSGNSETAQDGPQDCTQVVFLTDALSILEALSNDKEQELMTLPKSLSRNHRVSLQWIQVHCGIKGNGEADQLAKNGAGDTQP